MSTYTLKDMEKIVASKKCNECGANVLIVSKTFNRPDDLAFKRTFTKNVELSHYCDGGESEYLRREELAIKRADEARDNFNEWAAQEWDRL